MSLVIAIHLVCSWRTSRQMTNARVNMCVNKLFFQALESSPVVLLVSHCSSEAVTEHAAWSHTIFLKMRGNVQGIMVVCRHLAVYKA